MKKLVLISAFLFGYSLYAQTQKNAFVILDVGIRNNDKTSGNLFSAEHALKVVGAPYYITTNLDSAIQYKFILVSSNIEENTFTKAEKDTLINFVSKGGILFMTQLKDPVLYNLAGVNGYKYSMSHSSFNWILDSVGPAGDFIDDVNEKTIQLGDTSLVTLFGCRSYSLSNAMALAKFDNESVAFLKNQYQKGFVYLLGINWEDIILRNQVNKHFNAARSFSNAFDPGSDVFYLFFRGIYSAHNTFSVTKHTSIYNSNSILVITHDVDATSAIQDIMTDFSNYEYFNNIRATYFITTHYMHDSVAKDFWTGYADEIISVRNKNHEIASHSVSHSPDFDNSSIVGIGACGGADENTYRPFFDGTKSNSITACGEAEVSKYLLDKNTGATVKSFRAGYLAYNKYLLNALEQTGYEFNSTHSANNVLTAFPFQGHIDLSMISRPSSIYEIPNTISDVFNDEKISETNYNQKVDVWLDVQKRNAANHAPTVLLIHPNRLWKIVAQQNFIRNLPPKTAIVAFEEYGHYWKSREFCDFETTLEDDSILIITVKSKSLPFNKFLSFIVSNGQAAKQINVVDENGKTIPLLASKWKNNDLILHSQNFNEQYDLFDYEISNEIREFKLYPNPFSESTNIEFELFKDSQIEMKIYDICGRLIDEPINTLIGVGKYKQEYQTKGLGSGIYFYSFSASGQAPIKGKMIIKK